jgi:hypothetical protein
MPQAGCDTYYQQNVIMFPSLTNLWSTLLCSDNHLWEHNYDLTLTTVDLRAVLQRSTPYLGQGL